VKDTLEPSSQLW